MVPKRKARAKPKAKSTTRKIPLTTGGSATVSSEDYPALSKHSWYGADINGHTYPARREGSGDDEKMIYMHREVQPTDKPVVHHKSNKGTDNSRENLKGASVSENQKGIPHRRKRGKAKGKG